EFSDLIANHRDSPYVQRFNQEAMDAAMIVGGCGAGGSWINTQRLSLPERASIAIETAERGHQKARAPFWVIEQYAGMEGGSITKEQFVLEAYKNGSRDGSKNGFYKARDASLWWDQAVPSGVTRVEPSLLTLSATERELARKMALGQGIKEIAFEQG